MKTTGKSGCRGTPYEEWEERTSFSDKFTRRARTSKAITTALKMVVFLCEIHDNCQVVDK